MNDRSHLLAVGEFQITKKIKVSTKKWNPFIPYNIKLTKIIF